MALKINVPTLDSPAKAQELRETILTSEPDAHIEIDLESRTVTIEAKASEATFTQLIVAVGHTIQ